MAKKELPEEITIRIKEFPGGLVGIIVEYKGHTWYFPPIISERVEYKAPKALENVIPLAPLEKIVGARGLRLSLPAAVRNVLSRMEIPSILVPKSPEDVKRCKAYAPVAKKIVRMYAEGEDLRSIAEKLGIAEKDWDCIFYWVDYYRKHAASKKKRGAQPA